MIFRKTLASVAAPAIVATFCAVAQSAPAAEPKPPVGSGLDALGDRAKTADALFAVLDADGNGRIDRPEWQTHKMAIFYRRDVNNDIQLSRGELPGLAQDRFSEADFNMNGVLSGYEFNQAAFSQFDKADTDGDGSLSESEFRGYMAAIGAAR